MTESQTLLEMEQRYLQAKARMASDGYETLEALNEFLEAQATLRRFFEDLWPGQVACDGEKVPLS